MYWYLFNIANVGILFYKVGQTLQGLNLDKSYMRTNKIQREYKMQQPNVVIRSGIVETRTDEIELHSSY